MHHVVRTVVYVIDMADTRHIARAHSEALRSNPLCEYARPGRRPHDRLRTGRDRSNGDHLGLTGQPDPFEWRATADEDGHYCFALAL
jgi:hypothetical protein